jgi:hypothetical protein
MFCSLNQNVNPRPSGLAAIAARHKFCPRGVSGAGKSTLVQHRLMRPDSNNYHGLHILYGGLQRLDVLKTV